jgi:spermidine/putrescine transport system substrate-binding protein
MSNFARYANSIAGSEEFMDPEMATAPEVVAPEGATVPTFIPTCSQEVSQFYTRIWNDLLK